MADVSDLSKLINAPEDLVWFRQHASEVMKAVCALLAAKRQEALDGGANAGAATWSEAVALQLGLDHFLRRLDRPATRKPRKARKERKP